jgi:hypothetical protein
LLVPWRWFRAWLASNARSNRDALVAGLVGTIFVAALSALLGVVIAALNLLDFGGKLPAGLAFAAGAVGLLIGFLIGALVSRWYYKPRFDKATQTAGLLPRIRVYATHLGLLLDSLPQKSVCDLTQSLLGPARKCIHEATGQEVRFSIWVERPSGAHQMLELDLGPDHSEAERDAFRVPLDHSWLAWAGKQNRDEELLSGISDIPNGKHLGDDLRAIQHAGYGAVRCVAIENDGTLTRLVALGQQAHCFTPIEDEYIALLGLILTISRRLETLRQGEDPDGQDMVTTGA